MKVTLETTADGSPTLYREDIDEHYHSIKGAFTESKYIYIDCAWRKAALKSCSPVKVFEIGFGTGLNSALTSMAAAESRVSTIYHSIELYPLSPEISQQYAAQLSAEFQNAFHAVNSAVWNNEIEINPYFTLIKTIGNLLSTSFPQDIDVIYYDAFAPEKQPEMWDASIFSKIYQSMNQGGILTTYCAKGAIRRMLQKIGFSIERLPGPPGGKREIIRASKQ